MKTIIRIEHNDGFGMFRKNWDNGGRFFCVSDTTEGNPFLMSRGVDGWLMDNLWNRHSAHSDCGMPTPYSDGIDLDLDDKDWYCAFKSLEEFSEWVKPKEADALTKLDFKILMLDVTEYQEGEKQVAYTKESISSFKDISGLFKLKVS